MTYTTEIDIEKILRSTNVRKAAGIDDLSGRFLKDGSWFLSKPISELCNLSIELGGFSDSCKIAKLKPLFKKGSKTSSSNYRPISLLPLISKIIEKLIHGQASSFYLTMNFYTTISEDFVKTRQTHASHFCTINFYSVLIRDWWLAWYWLTYKKGIWYNWPWYTIEKVERYWFPKSYYWLVQFIPF